MSDAPAPEPAPRERRWLWWGPVLGAATLVVLIRSLGFEYVFVDGEVVFPPADPQYHLRRGLQVFERFPDVLLFDPYINYPGGAPIPWPPLYDIVMGAVPRFAGADEHGFEVFAAWLSPLCALLACVPIAGIARRTSGEQGPRVPALAITIFALVPLLVSYGRVGMADHHAAVSMIGAWLLLCCVAQVDPGLGERSARRWMWAHVAARLALLLTWHGSLLYLGIAEGSLALAFISTGRRGLALHQAIGAAVTALVLVPVLAVMPTPLGGPYSAIALSRLHVIAMLGVAMVLGAGLLATRQSALDAPIARLGALALASLVFIAGVLALPGPREGLGPALEFLTMTDGVGDVTGEQLPIFDLGARRAIKPFPLVWSWWAPLIPLVPIGVALVARRQPPGSAGRAAAWMLCLWTAIFGALAITQRRYGNDFGPAAAVGLALGFVWLADALAARLVASPRRSAVATSLALLFVLLTAWPALARVHGPRAVSSWRALRGDEAIRVQARTGIGATLSRFLRQVRHRTPETAGYFDDAGEPEYGVIAHPNLGHAIQYEARRPTATDPFWAYIGRENWALTQGFVEATDEAEARVLADRLDGRYVITMPQLPPGSVMQRLHDGYGTATRDAPGLGHFRFVAEAPSGAPALGEVFQPGAARRGSPYKLFEIVAGADLVFACPAGTRARVQARIEHGRGTFVWRTHALADETGRVRVRIPYATANGEAAGGGVADGPLRVECGDRAWPVRIPAGAVREGREVTAPAPPPVG